jgi:hypothetical protein
MPGSVKVVSPTLTAHHHVPDQAGHGERHFQPPKTLPDRKAEAAGGFIQVRRHRGKALVHGKGHVPGLAGENGEHHGELGADHPAGEQPEEEGDGERQEAEDRQALQDVENRNKHQAGTPAFGCPGGVGEGEQQGQGECREHAQRGAQRVAGQVPGIEMDRHRLGGAQRGQGVTRGIADRDQAGGNEQHRGQIKKIWQAPDGRGGGLRRVGHRRAPSRWVARL